MPDFQIDERERQARLTGRFNAAKIEAAVERCGPAGPQRCPGCNGLGRTQVGRSVYYCADCDGKGQVSASPAILSWIEFRDLAVAGDGRYVVRRVKTGWIATAYQDGIERLSPVMTEVLCREWAEAREMDRKLAETAEHEALPMHEVGEGSGL